MDIGSVLLGLALLVVIGFLVARPLLERPDVNDQPASPAEQLLERREQVLTQLRDIDFDAAMSKINPEDYAAQRAQLVAEGVAILKQLDALGGGPDRAVAAAAGADSLATQAAPLDDIEAAVALLRARRAKSTTADVATTAPALAKLMPGATVAATPVARSLDDEIEAGVAARRAAAAGAEKAVPSTKPATPATFVCAVCAAEVLPDDRFCPKCGSALTLACANCGRVGRAGDPFCANCGQPLGQSLASPATGLRQAESAGG